MKFCPNCGKQLPAISRFCSQCGSPLPVETPVASVAKPAPAAPVPVTPVDVPPTEELPAGAIPADTAPETPTPVAPPDAPTIIPAKTIWFGVLLLIGLLLLTLVVGWLAKHPSGDAAVGLYIKNATLFYSELNKGDDAIPLATIVDAGAMADVPAAQTAAAYARGIYISDDGKWVIYPDHASPGDPIELYCRRTDKPRFRPIKIANDVYQYDVSDNTEIVTYLDTNHNLYRYTIDTHNNEQVDNHVEYFYVSEDGDNLVYTTANRAVYGKHADNPREKMSADNASLEVVAPDCSFVYYTDENGVLYKHELGKDPVSIAQNVRYVATHYPSGELYYVRQNNEQADVALSTFVEDDMAETDKDITEPPYPDRPRRSDFATEEDYQAAQEQYAAGLDAYDAQYNAYTAKKVRDQWRDYLKTATIDLSGTSLCYFDGTEETVLTDRYIAVNDSRPESPPIHHAADIPAVVFGSAQTTDVGKFKLSEIADFKHVEELSSKILEAFTVSIDYSVAVKGTVIPLGIDSIATPVLNDDGTVMYYFPNVPARITHRLYRMDIRDSSVSEPQLYAEDVLTLEPPVFLDTDTVSYCVERAGSWDLFINRTLIATDAGGCLLDEQSGHIYYTAKEDNHSTALYVYDGKTSTLIDTNIHTFVPLCDGRVLYLRDFDQNTFEGDLYVCDKKKTVCIDTDVNCLVSHNDAYAYTFGY